MGTGGVAGGIIGRGGIILGGIAVGGINGNGGMATGGIGGKPGKPGIIGGTKKNYQN